MTKEMIGVITLLSMLIIVGICGCTSTPANNTATAQPQEYQKHILICPNPDCLLHDPNKGVYYNGDRESKVRPINCVAISDPSPTSPGYTSRLHYICQVCGEEWNVKV